MRASDAELGPAGELAGVLVGLLMDGAVLPALDLAFLGPLVCARDGAVLNGPRARDRPQLDGGELTVAPFEVVVRHGAARPHRHILEARPLGSRAHHPLVGRGGALVGATVLGLALCADGELARLQDLGLEDRDRVVGEVIHLEWVAWIFRRVASQGGDIQSHSRWRWRHRRRR